MSSYGITTKYAANHDGLWRHNEDGTWTLLPDFHGRITPLQSAFAQVEAGYWQLDPVTGEVFSKHYGKTIGRRDNKGYLLVATKLVLPDGRSASRDVLAHRLIWQRFNGPIMDTSRQINHIDGVKHHNALANMELVTGSQNVRHALRTGLMGHTPHLTVHEVRAIRTAYAATHSYRKAAEAVGVKVNQVAHVIQKVTFRSVL